MPVLDAKALEIDPKGAAFLKSVLRESHTSKILPKKVPGIGRIRLRIISRLHLSGRSKGFRPQMA